jgi:hypothetical protein
MSMALLASLTIASPAPAPAPAAVSARNVAETDLIAETIVFSVESAKCKLLKCATVIATGACILSALPDLESTLACVGGNAEDVSQVERRKGRMRLLTSASSCAIVPGV